MAAAWRGTRRLQAAIKEIAGAKAPVVKQQDHRPFAGTQMQIARPLDGLSVPREDDKSRPLPVGIGKGRAGPTKHSRPR